MEALILSRDWYAYNALHGTSEEKAFVRLLDRQMRNLRARYEEIYLLRNEGHFSIYSFYEGQTFQPDFVLFLKDKRGGELAYQVFIEPKGRFLGEHDAWKARFLSEISAEFGPKLLSFENTRYQLVGIPFYNYDNENQFKSSLESALQPSAES